MTDEDRHRLVGRLVSELATHVQELKRARLEAAKLAPHLRILADCFDKDRPETQMDHLDGSRFTFRSSSERKKLRSMLPGQTVLRDGVNRPEVTIPSGATLNDLAVRIRVAEDSAESVLESLRNENIDVRGICVALANCE